MQPERSDIVLEGERTMGGIMERVILEVRRHWFAAHEESLGCATRVVEDGGEMLTLVDGNHAEVIPMINEAVDRGTFVVATSHSRPADLRGMLRDRGFHLVQRQGAYVYRPGAPLKQTGESRRGLLSLLRRRDAGEVTIEEVSEAELTVWNEICCKAFDTRISTEEARAEKRRAFLSMGAKGRWYLARVNGRPVGTACLFQSESAAQVLAVGTLPSQRGRGVATRLMQRVICDWESSGSGFLFLDAAPGSQAERIYLKLGFGPAYVRELYAPGVPTA